MSLSRVLSILLLAPGLLGTACRREAPEPGAGAARYPIKGRVVAVDAAARELTLDHEEIPGFMPAMTMPFVVLEKDAVLLQGVSPGDEVSASLVVPDSRYWIEDLVVVKTAVPDPDRTPRPTARMPQPGDAVPDVVLVDQDGREVRLSDFRGRAVALTFVFTRCPLPDFCPLMMRRFRQVHEAAVADPRLLERTHLVTVSFDPAHDTPAVLKAYGRPFQRTEPPFTHWTLATGSEEAIRTLGGALGLDYVEEERSFTHNLRTAVIDPDGRLFSLRRGNDWTAEQLLRGLRAAIAGPGPDVTKPPSASSGR